MEKQMRKTGNSFLSGKSKLSISKVDAGEDSVSSEDEKKTNKSGLSERRTLMQQSEGVSITRANFGARLMSEHPSASDEETRKPV